MSHERAVYCSSPGCREAAAYKVAAPWSDRRFSELKTYGFACHDHLADILRDAETRWLDYDPAPGETIQEIGIFHFVPGTGDRKLVRDRDLEQSLRA